MALGFLALDGCRYCAALLVSEDNHQFRAEVLDAILDAAENDVVHEVSGNSYDEEIAQAFVKEQLGRHARICAAENHGERMLVGDQAAPAIEGIVGVPFLIRYKTRVPGQKPGERLVRGESRGFLGPGAGSESEDERRYGTTALRDGE